MRNPIRDQRNKFLDNLMEWIARLASQTIEDPSYKPSSYWLAKSYPREEPGVLAKAINLIDRVRIVERGLGYVEAIVPSESKEGENYKVKIEASPLTFDYSCTCPHGEHRFNPCKHVVASVLRIVADGYRIKNPKDFFTKNIDGRTVAVAIHTALNNHAYIKSRIKNIYA